MKTPKRCATHAREHIRRVKADAHDRYAQRTYGLAPGEYQEIYDAQGGKCAICRRATGKTKRLAVDHDHRLEGRESVRGLLCGPDNQMIGYAHDDPEFFERAAAYLRNPPAQRLTSPPDQA